MCITVSCVILITYKEVNYQILPIKEFKNENILWTLKVIYDTIIRVWNIHCIYIRCTVWVWLTRESFSVSTPFEYINFFHNKFSNNKVIFLSSTVQLLNDYLLNIRAVAIIKEITFFTLLWKVVYNQIQRMVLCCDHVPDSYIKKYVAPTSVERKTLKRFQTVQYQ